MNLSLNGELREIPGIRTLPELVEALGLPAAALLIEHNGLALLRGEWADRPLAEGDRIEFLRITAGG
ncbi:MAG: sulfur carrier protein ThiS [Verrucomicrobiota bacterium]